MSAGKRQKDQACSSACCDVLFDVVQFALRDTLSGAERTAFSTDDVLKVLLVDLFKEHKHGYS